MKKRWISAASESDTDSSVAGSVRASESKDVEGEARPDEPVAADDSSAMQEAKDDQPKQMPHFIPIAENEFADDDVYVYLFLFRLSSPSLPQ